jgi:hypothetical protein
MAFIFTLLKSRGEEVARCSAVKNSLSGEMVDYEATMSFGTMMFLKP